LGFHTLYVRIVNVCLNYVHEQHISPSFSFR
jgi:hypothetical protein